MKSKSKDKPAPEGWQLTGLCRVCMRPIEAWQPGGGRPRHVEDRSAICGERKA